MGQSEQSTEQQLVNIMDGIGESAFEMSNEDVQQECLEDGDDINRSADKVRAIFRKVINGHREQRELR